MRILDIDTETTRLDPGVDRVVEVAGVPVEMGASGVWSALPGASTLVNPGCRIPPEVSAVSTNHHILDELVNPGCRIPPEVSAVSTNHHILDELVNPGCRALCDATVTATLLTVLLAGRALSDVPTDYLQWVERQDFDADVRLTVNTELKRRKA